MKIPPVFFVTVNRVLFAAVFAIGIAGCQQAANPTEGNEEVLNEPGSSTPTVEEPSPIAPIAQPAPPEVPQPEPVPEDVSRPETEPEQKPNPTPSPPGTGVPYFGTPMNVPGLIEAENFDIGSAIDSDMINRGAAYRDESVDIQTAATNGFNVGWTVAGESLSYSINVVESGMYQLSLLTAALANEGQISVLIDSSIVLSHVTLPVTHGWQDYQWTTVGGFQLSAGRYTLSLLIDEGGFNINTLELIQSDTPAPVPTPEPPPEPAPTLPPAPEPEPSPGSDLAAQLQAGSILYNEQCVVCHGDTGQGGAISRALEIEGWSLVQLASKISLDMPPASPATCVDECATNIAAYMLNGYSIVVSDDEQTLPPPAEPPTEICAADITQASPARRLNKYELDNVITDLFDLDDSFFSSLPQDATLGGFATVGSYLSSGALFTERYFEAVTTVAEQLVSGGYVTAACASNSVEDIFDIPQGDQCDTTSECKMIFGDAADDCADSRSNTSVCMCSNSRCDAMIEMPEPTQDCYANALEPYARLMFRRELTADELANIQLLASTQTRLHGEAAGLTAGLLYLLTSTDFLFIKQNLEGSTTRDLSGSELATRLALTLWGSLPDNDLLNAALAGDLEEPTEIEAQINRMMSSPKFKRFEKHFFDQWLALDNVTAVDVSHNAFGMTQTEWQAIASDMQQETRHFVSHIVEGNRTIKELFSADYSFLNERLANHYGIESGNNDSAFIQTPLPFDQPRRGLMTQGAVLTRASSGDHASVVIRGENVLAGFLCDPPTPPGDSILDQVQDQLDSPETEKEKMNARAANVVCAACHASLDPLGWAFSEFDPVGRLSATDPDGDPTNPVGAYKGHMFASVPELVDILDKQDRFAVCLSEKFLIYAVGRSISYDNRQEDQCAIDTALAELAEDADHAGIKDIIKSLLLSKLFKLHGTIVAD